jgi:hypothetical protein
MSQEWEIKSCSRLCAGTNQPFVDGQSIHSCLMFGAEGYQRKDFSEAGWTDEARQSAVSFWKSVYHEPDAPTPEAVKKETAETLLRQFLAKDDYTRINAIYILAVMLERKRVLVERDVQIREDGTKVLIYEHKKTGEVFTIPDPQLKLGELTQVQQEVAELLGFTARPEPPPSPAVGPS